MTLVDDLKAPTSPEELDRRKALGYLVGAAFAAAGGGAVITTIRFMQPKVLFEPPTKVSLGPADNIPLGSLVVLPEQKLYVAHIEKGIIAMSSVCTHLGCMTRYDAEQKQITCPCHGSEFDENGQVTGGPAPRPLDRKLVTIESGQLVVDTNKNVEADYVLEV